MNSLPKRLYELRTQRNLKQEELAEALGVSRQAVSKWEMGTGVPSLENLKAISDFFGVTIDSLVKDSPDPEENARASDSTTPPPPISGAADGSSNGFRSEKVNTVIRAKELLPPIKTLFNAVLLIAAQLFAFFTVNGIQFLLTQFAGNASLEALIGYTKVQPFLVAAMNFVFSFPLYYFMTAVFRDGACLLSLGRGYPKRLPCVILLWLISTLNLIVTGLFAQSSSVFSYYLAAPALSCAVYLIFYLILTRAKGFDRKLKVLLPALGVMLCAAAVFTLIIFAAVSSESLTTGERLARISWIIRAEGAVIPAVSLAALTVLYDYGRKKGKN